MTSVGWLVWADWFAPQLTGLRCKVLLVAVTFICCVMGHMQGLMRSFALVRHGLRAWCYEPFAGFSIVWGWDVLEPVCLLKIFGATFS